MIRPEVVSSRREQTKGLLFAYCNMMINYRWLLYSRALEYFGQYDSKLDPKIKIELGIFSLSVGSIGFIV